MGWDWARQHRDDGFGAAGAGGDDGGWVASGGDDHWSATNGLALAPAHAQPPVLARRTEQRPARRAAPPIAGVERRLAALAVDAWAAAGGAYVGGFDVNSVLIADPAGLALVEEVGDTIAARFGIVPGLALARQFSTGAAARVGLAAELAAACDLISLSPVPLPFETSLASADGALVLLRGVALPIIGGADAGKVQAIVNWRQVLGRAASQRLRDELGAALLLVRNGQPSRNIDPFSQDFAPKPA